MTDPSTKPRLNEAEKQLVEKAAEQSDAMWDYGVAIGEREPRGGAEYMRRCLAPQLREMAS